LTNLVSSKSSSDNKFVGLDYKEPIIVTNSEGYVFKNKIGDFVESYLTENEKNWDSIYKEISQIYVTSFNPNTFSYELEEVIGISKTKSDFVFNLVFDDNSNIKLAENTICYKFENCNIDKIEAKNVKIGDYFPLSNSIIQTKTPRKYVNMLYYNVNRKVNIKDLIESIDNKSNAIYKFLSSEFTSAKWKLRNILDETKERGISIDQMNRLLSELDLTLEESNHHIRIITKGKDKLNPLIPISQDFVFFSGLYLAEGNTTRNTIHISNSDKNLQKRCQKFANNQLIHFRQSNKNDIVYNSVLFASFFAEMGKNAYMKHVPSIFYNIEQDLLSIFLQALFDGDGWVEPNSICYLSASSKLIFDIKNLLLYFAISSRILVKNRKYMQKNGNIIPKRYFLLTISGKKNLELFLRKISFSLNYKKNALKDAIKPKENTNVDLIPNCSQYIKSLRRRSNLSQKEMALHVKCQRSYISLIENNKRFPSKKIFSKIIDFEENNNDIRNMLEFNFRYITKINKKRTNNRFVYGLVTKNNQCFSAGNGNIFVHVDKYVI